jgi:hypothetical protein
MKNDRKSERGESQRKQQAAADLAISALNFIAGEQERLARFLALSGIGPQSLRAAAREPDFLLGVLDYVVGDESLLLAFAQESGIAPDDVARARNTLAGRGGETGAA